MDILPEMPEIVRQYALYYRNIKGRAPLGAWLLISFVKYRR